MDAAARLNILRRKFGNTVTAAILGVTAAEVAARDVPAQINDAASAFSAAANDVSVTNGVLFPLPTINPNPIFDESVYAVDTDRVVVKAKGLYRVVTRFEIELEDDPVVILGTPKVDFDGDGDWAVVVGDWMKLTGRNDGTQYSIAAGSSRFAYTIEYIVWMGGFLDEGDTNGGYIDLGIVGGDTVTYTYVRANMVIHRLGGEPPDDTY